MARRDDNIQARLDRDLAELKLPEIAKSYREVLAEAACKGSSMLEVLATLIGLEQTARQQRALQRRLRAARLPKQKTLVEYDFNFPKRISKEKVLQLFDCDFIKRHGCAVLLGPTGTGKSQPMNTPLVTQECEGQVTVTDPCHPLYGRTFTLSGLAVLPGHVRHCQVEILPGQVAYIPVAATNLSTEPRPQPAVLTASAVEELVAAFQAVGGRRHNHATRPKPACLDAPGPRRTNRRHHGDRQGSHAGRGT